MTIQEIVCCNIDILACHARVAQGMISSLLD